jgi:hypothetical protein
MIFLYVLYSTLLQLPPIRFHSVRIFLDRTQVALKKRKCHSADILTQVVKKWRMVSVGEGGGHRRQDGVGASSILRWWGLVALTSRRSCGREKWTSTASGSKPGDCSLG